MQKNQEPKPIKTQVAAIAKILRLQASDVVTFAAANMTISRTLLRRRHDLMRIESVLPLPPFIVNIAKLDAFLTLELFRHPNRDLYLTGRNKLSLEQCCEVAFFHQDDPRVMMVILHELEQNPEYDTHLAYTTFLQHMIEKTNDWRDLSQGLIKTLMRSALYNLKQRLQILETLYTSLVSFGYGKNHETFADTHSRLTGRLLMNYDRLRKKAIEQDAFNMMPLALLAKIRFNMVYHSDYDIPAISTYTESFFEEEILWAELLEAEYGPIVLSDMSYQNCYGLKKWVERTIALIEDTIHEENPTFKRSTAMKEILAVLQTLFIHGDQSAGIQYVQLTEKIAYQNCTTTIFFPINIVIAQSIYATLFEVGYQPETLAKVKPTLDSVQANSNSPQKLSKSSLAFLNGRKNGVFRDPDDKKDITPWKMTLNRREQW